MMIYFRIFNEDFAVKNIICGYVSLIFEMIHIDYVLFRYNIYFYRHENISGGI